MKTILGKVLFFIICYFFLVGSVRAEKPQTASVSFAWSVPTALSVFEREEYIWVVFDGKRTIDIKAMEDALAEFEAEILQIPHSRAIVLRIKTNVDTTPYVRKEGLLWVIDFREDAGFPDIESLNPVVHYDSLDRGYVFLQTQDFVEPLSVVDPSVGDVILIGASQKNGIGVEKPYSFVDFDLLKSVQGFAVVPKIDGLFVDRGNKGISIKADEDGLNVSRNLDALKRNEKLVESIEDESNFNLDIEPSLLAKRFIESEAELKEGIRIASKELKNKARFELAKYYVAKGLGYEALALIEYMLKQQVGEENKQSLFGLRGAANLLVKNYAQAIEDLSYIGLEKSDTAVFWKDLARALMDPEYRDNTTLMAFAPIIKNYPIELKNKIALKAAQVSIDARDDLSAQNFIDILNLTAIDNPLIVPELSFLNAGNLYLQGYTTDAYDEFNFVATTSSQRFSSFARYEAALIGFSIKALKINEAIAELEKVKFSWGSVSFRKKIYKSLARLYVIDKDYANAVHSMNEEMKISTEEEKLEVERRIIALFEDLYLYNQADEIPPLKALSLYDEYINFIKKSRHYTDVVINVADRFVAVDLLDKAAKILEEELLNPDILDEQRYKIGTRLALVYTYKSMPEKVFESLDVSDYLHPATSLENYRNILKARAYKENKQYDEALRELDGNFSELAVLLRSEIFWLNKDWEDLSTELKFLIDEPIDGQTLSEEQSKYILDWLMAVKKAGKQNVLFRARAKFLPWFEGSKYYGSFDVLTSQFEYNKLDMNDIERRINSMVSYSDFSKKVNDNLSKVGRVEKVEDKQVEAVEAPVENELEEPQTTNEEGVE